MTVPSRLVLVLLFQFGLGGEARCETHPLRDGPWGQIEATKIFLHPDDSVVDNMAIPSARTVWRFSQIKTFEGLETFLNAVFAKRDDESFRLLQSEIALQEISGREMRAFPSRKFLLSLSQEERKAIYRVLARDVRNPFHHKPVFIDSPSPARWFAGTALNEEALQLIEKLSYPVGQSLAFSDLPLLLDTVTKKSEELAVWKELMRSSTLHLELKVSPETNLEKIRSYWIPGHRSAAGLPVFESLTRDELLPASIDLVEILPGLPRKYLAEYPSVIDGLNGVFPGGFWTSLNFFEQNPEVEMLTEEETVEWIEQHYRKVEAPYRFGDLILFSDQASGRLLHTCIYIADDIAFTKNGRGVLTPWVMMKLPGITARFSVNHIPVLSGRRPLSP